MAAEIWGYCDQCERWFYCEGWRDSVEPHPTCPVCGIEASRLDDHAATNT
jgi:hypothetical protein